MCIDGWSSVICLAGDEILSLNGQQRVIFPSSALV
jgi:hypothetical protein